MTYAVLLMLLTLGSIWESTRCGGCCCARDAQCGPSS
jgi:hypothetical protein